jgi:NAD(P)-dependent dehydrogenase (short-subunit alcohol dehydrogenase family)
MERDPLFDVTGKVAWVTGASSGLGAHFAHMLAARGATVVAAARRVDRLEALVRQIEAEGGKAIAVRLDVASADSVAAALEQATGEVGAPDIVVNNAGVAQAKPSLALTEADWRQVLDTNLDGAWRVAQGCARAMIAAKKGGSIVNIASILGLRVATSLLAYATAKAALLQATRALALEWARHGIRVNAIAPGYIETEMNRGFFRTEAGEAMVKRVPQRRIGSPADLDGALLLLASPASAYMTGAVVVVDGGHLVSSL